MPTHDSKLGSRDSAKRFTDELPRVDSEKPDAWPPNFIPPPIRHSPSGVLIGGRPRTRPSFVCPSCGRGARSLWFGVVPTSPEEAVRADSDALDPKTTQPYHPTPAGGATGAPQGADGKPQWLCWRCLGLVRRSQWRCPSSRATDRARAIRRELGAPEVLYSGEPPPPPEMTLSTDPERGLLEYDELTDSLRRAEFESLDFPDQELRELRGY